MHRSLLISALSALVAKSMAQLSADFENMSFGNVTVGQLWPIYWSAGNGETVSLSVGNGSYSASIFTDVPATPGNYNWTVTVSPDFIAGFYSLALSQTGAGTSTSPTFYVSFADDVPPRPNNTTDDPTSPTVASTTTIPPATTTNATLPTVTIVWYEEDCSCTRTSTCNTIALPTATNGTICPTTYYEEQCGCTRTAYPPAWTMAPAANNYTIPTPKPAPQRPAAAPAAGSPTEAGPAKAAYTGAAVKVTSAGFGLPALIAAAFAL